MTEFFDSINQYPFRKILIWIIIVMAGIVSLLLITLIAHKLYVESRERRFKRLKEIFIPMISKRFTESAALEKYIAGTHPEMVGDVIIDILASISGEIEEEVKGYARAIRLGEYFKKRTLSRLLMRRIVAIEKLGLLKLPEMKPFYHKLLGDEKDNEILARTILALSFIADNEPDIRIINLILKNPSFKSSKFNEYIYTNIIKSFVKNKKEDILFEFLKCMRDDDSMPVFLKKDIIEACGSEAFYPSKEIIIGYFYCFNDEPSMKIACVRALGRLGGEEICSIIGECLEDEDWRVRAVASKNAQICTGDVIDNLSKALKDKNYYVRINSAISLSKLGSKGLSALQKELAAGDRFSRDVSRFILAEVNIRA